MTKQVEKSRFIDMELCLRAKMPQDAYIEEDDPGWQVTMRRLTALEVERLIDFLRSEQ
jgi:hypothetical protein